MPGWRLFLEEHPIPIIKDSLSSVNYMQFRRYTIVTLKYFLATAISFYLANWIEPTELLSIIFIAVLTLQPNLYRGLQFSWTQLTTTTLATVITTIVIIGLQLDLEARPTVFTTSVAMGVTIFFSLKLGLKEGTVIALFTVTYLAAIPLLIESSFLHGIFLRYLTIVLGVGAASLVNFLSSLFRYRDRIFLHLVDLSVKLNKKLQSLSDLLIENRGEVPEASRLNDFLNNFNPLFTSLRELRRDLNEIAKEVKFFRRSEHARENEHYRNLLNALNDLSHYLWDLLLNLMNYQFDRETITMVEDEFVRLSTDLSGLFTRLEKMRSRPVSSTKKVNRRIERLNHKMNQVEADSPEAGAPLMAVYSDLIHLNLNLLQFEKYLEQLISFRQDAG